MMEKMDIMLVLENILLTERKMAGCIVVYYKVKIINRGFFTHPYPSQEGNFCLRG